MLLHLLFMMLLFGGGRYGPITAALGHSVRVGVAVAHIIISILLLVVHRLLLAPRVEKHGGVVCSGCICGHADMVSIHTLILVVAATFASHVLLLVLRLLLLLLMMLTEQGGHGEHGLSRIVHNLHASRGVRVDIAWVVKSRVMVHLLLL